MAIKLSGKSTIVATEGVINQVVTPVSQGAGWYFVKQTESLADVVNRIFKNPDSSVFQLMSKINPHLSAVALLQPGQVVVVALEENNPHVQRMMTEAKAAQRSFENAKQRLGGISDEFIMMLELTLSLGAVNIKQFSLDIGKFVSAEQGMVQQYKGEVDFALGFTDALRGQSRNAYKQVMDSANKSFDKKENVYNKKLTAQSAINRAMKDSGDVPPKKCTSNN